MTAHEYQAAKLRIAQTWEHLKDADLAEFRRLCDATEQYEREHRLERQLAEFAAPPPELERPLLRIDLLLLAIACLVVALCLGIYFS